MIGRASSRPGRRPPRPLRRSRGSSAATTHRADVGLDRTPPDVDDHRRAGMSASGFPGRRVEAMRAGIRTMGFGWLGRAKCGVKGGGRAYTCCQASAKRLITPLAGGARSGRLRNFSASKAPPRMDTSQFQSGRCWPCSGPSCSRWPSILTMRSRVLAVSARRFRASRCRQGPNGRRAGRRRPEGAAARAFRQGRRQEGRSGRQGLRDLPQFREGRRREGRPAALWRHRPPVASVPGFAYSDR